ncbi:MAG: hypothetical protein ABI789_03580, partial [Usitatibacter sp.]
HRAARFLWRWHSPRIPAPTRGRRGLERRRGRALAVWSTSWMYGLGATDPLAARRPNRRYGMLRTKASAVLLLFFVSGLCGLIYESVWTHYVKLFLGHAAYAQTLVLVVFVGGLALGSYLCARVAERIANPLRVYAAIEGAIGAIALVFHPVFLAVIEWGYRSLLPSACEPGATYCLPQWALAAALLAPQSILLGATFPLMSSAVLRMTREDPGHQISALYFLNSLGAVMGVLASAFLLIPSIGLPGSLMTAGGGNIAVALVAWSLSAGMPRRLDLLPQAEVAGQPMGDRKLLGIMLGAALLTGLSSFIYEIAWVRMLSLVLGASTHAFELMLASFILGLAFGGLWIRGRLDSSEDPVRLLGMIQMVMGVLAALSIPIYNGSFDLMAWLLSALQQSEAAFVLFNLSSTLIALLVMLPTTFCAGTTLPLVTYRLLRSSCGERALGLVYSVNTAGCVLGVVITVHFLLRACGLNATLLIGALIDVGLGAFLLIFATAGPRARIAPALAGIGMLAAIALAFQIDVRRSSSGVFRTGQARLSPADKIVFHRDGKTATVDVLESGGTRAIRTNGKTDAALIVDSKGPPTGDEYTMVMLSALPLGHRPDARTAAVIGLGSGMSTSVLLGSRSLQRVDTVEIEPAMVEGAQFFRPIVDAAFTDPRSHIVIDDAKSYFARGHTRYDIIVSEPSNPWVSGVASLFTEEFYARLAEYLNEGGVLSQWVHTYEMDSATLASILKAVSKTFPDFEVYSTIDADIILIARKGGPAGRFDPRALEFPALRASLERLKMADVDVIAHRRVAAWKAIEPLMRTFALPANSDYLPVVENRAAKTRFTRERANVLIELAAAPVPILEMVDATHPAAGPPRDASPVAISETGPLQAWGIYRALLGEDKETLSFAPGSRSSSAIVVRSWAINCRSDLPFEHLLPHLLAVAEATNPYLPADAAKSMWSWISSSKCGRRLPADDARWLALLDAIAQRDPERMVSTAMAIAPVSDASGKDLVVTAAATGYVCMGEYRKAKKLIDDYSGPMNTHLFYLLALSRPANPPTKLSGPCIRR